MCFEHVCSTNRNCSPLRPIPASSIPPIFLSPPEFNHLYFHPLELNLGSPHTIPRTVAVTCVSQNLPLEVFFIAPTAPSFGHHESWVWACGGSPCGSREGGSHESDVQQQNEGCELLWSGILDSPSVTTRVQLRSCASCACSPSFIHITLARPRR